MYGMAVDAPRTLKDWKEKKFMSVIEMEGLACISLFRYHTEYGRSLGTTAV